MNTETTPLGQTGFSHAETEADVIACFDLMRELRPHVQSPEEWLVRLARQKEQGYRLLVAWRDGAAVALAGYRYQDNLVYGRFLYVDDLVTLETERRHQWGQQLLEMLTHQAQAQGCQRLVLDTGMSNSLAQRFYFRQGMLATALRFTHVLN